MSQVDPIRELSGHRADPIREQSGSQSGPIREQSVSQAEVGIVTFKSNIDEVLSDEFILKSNGDEALNYVFHKK